MPWSNILPIIFLAMFAGSAAWFTARLLAYRPTLDQAELPPFDAARYAPMGRLLDPADGQYLASQPGVTRADVARFEQSRRQTFRLYLRELAADFGALHAQAREMVAVSPEENHELVENLIRMQIRFWMAVVSIELQLAAEAAGIGRVDPSRILAAVESLNAAILRASAVPGPVAV